MSRSLSRKAILRIAGRHAGRAAPVRRGLWKSWDAPTHSTPLADIQHLRQSFAPPIGGTFTLAFGSQISEPLSYDTSKEVIDHAVNRLISADRSVRDRLLHALIASRAIRHN